MTTWYAQSGSCAFDSAYWNDQSGGGGNSGSPTSGDTADSNGQSAIDCADKTITGISLTGTGYVSSKWYARSGSCAFSSVTWNACANGSGVVNPSGSASTVYLYSNSQTAIDCADVSLSSPLNMYLNDYSAWYSTKLYATYNNSWGSMTWSTESNGYGFTQSDLQGAPASWTCTHYSNSYSCDIADVDLSGTAPTYTLSGTGFWSSSHYARNGSRAWSSVTWNTRSDGKGKALTPGSGNYETAYDNSQTGIDCADVNLYDSNINASGSGFISSKWYAQSTETWGNCGWNAQSANKGIYGPPSGTATCYHQSYAINCADVDLTGLTLSASGAGSWTSDKWYARASAAWSSALWNARAGGSGLTTPGPATKSAPAYDTADINGKTVTLDASCTNISRISVTDGTYTGTLGVGASCTLTNWTTNITLTWSGAYTVTTAGTAMSTHYVAASGSAKMVVGGTTYINGTFTGGATCTIPYNAACTASLTIGSSSSTLEWFGGLEPSSEVLIQSGGLLKAYGARSVTGSYGDIKLEAGSMLLGAPATGDYTDPGEANVRKSTTYYFEQALKTGTAYIPAASNVLDGVQVDAGTGTYEVVVVADVKDGVFFGDAGTLEGTYNPLASAVWPLAANVWHGAATYGPTGVEYDPEMYASDITHCVPANVKSGVSIDDVNGDYNPLSTATWPDADNVWHTADPYGPAGNDYTPSFHASDISDCTPGNIKDGIVIDDVPGDYDPLDDCVWPSEANVSTTETAWGPTGAEYAGALDLGDYTLTAGMVWPSEANVSTTETAWGPTGAEYAGALDLATYVLKVSVVAASYVLTGHKCWTPDGDDGTYSGGGGGGTYPGASLVLVGTQYGPGGTDYTGTRTDCPADKALTTSSYGAPNLPIVGTVDIDLYTLISGVAGADDVRAGKARYSGGANGNLIVPTAELLALDACAGWHHTGTPDTYEVTGTLVAIEPPATPDQATGQLIVYDNENTPASEVDIYVQFVSPDSSDEEGHGYSNATRTVTSGENGIVLVTGLFRGCTYKIWRGSGTAAIFVVPEDGEPAPEEPFDLPTIQGDDAEPMLVWPID